MNLEKYINDFFSHLGAGSRETVYLSVTPGVGLEMIQMDAQTKSIKAYASRPLEYNESLREIANYDDFKLAVDELFSELNLSTKCNVVVNLPMALFGSINLPLLLPDDSVTEAVTSEVEQSYIFKRHEPIVSWVDAPVINGSGEVRKLFYSAIQKQAVDNIGSALGELGATLTGVEMSMTSVLKALSYSGLASNQMKDEMTWNLMLVNSSGYSVVAMSGKNIIDYYEEPLALKSFELDEVYNAINASAQITLMSYPANYLYIISNTDTVSAELLSKKIQASGSIDFLENNSFRKKEIVPVSLNILPDELMKISLEAVGISSNVEMPVKFNFVHGAEIDQSLDSTPVKFKVGEKEIELTPTAAQNISYITAAVLIVPLLLLFLGLPMYQKNMQRKLDNINMQVQDLDMQIQKLSDDQARSGNFDIKKEIKTVLKSNRSKLLAYTALGESITGKVWLTYFMTKDDGNVDIKGESASVEDIYFFFKNLKDSLITTKLRMHKLEMNTGSVDDVVEASSSEPMDYRFELTNMSEAQLNPQAVPADADKAKSPVADMQEGMMPNQNGKKSPLLGTSPLMNIGKNGSLPEN